MGLVTLQEGSLGLSMSQNKLTSPMTGWTMASQWSLCEFSLILMPLRGCMMFLLTRCLGCASSAAKRIPWEWSEQFRVTHLPYVPRKQQNFLSGFQIICPAWPHVRSSLYHRRLLRDMVSPRCCFGPGSPVLCEPQQQTQWQIPSWYIFTLFCEWVKGSKLNEEEIVWLVT